MISFADFKVVGLANVDDVTAIIPINNQTGIITLYEIPRTRILNNYGFIRYVKKERNGAGRNICMFERKKNKKKTRREKSFFLYENNQLLAPSSSTSDNLHK